MVVGFQVNGHRDSHTKTPSSFLSPTFNTVRIGYRFFSPVGQKPTDISAFNMSYWTISTVRSYLIVIKHRQALDLKSSQTGNTPLPFTFTNRPNIVIKTVHDAVVFHAPCLLLQYFGFKSCLCSFYPTSGFFPVTSASLPVIFDPFQPTSASLPVIFSGPQSFNPQFPAPLFVRKRGHHLL